MCLLRPVLPSKEQTVTARVSQPRDRTDSSGRNTPARTWMSALVYTLLLAGVCLLPQPLSAQHHSDVPFLPAQSPRHWLTTAPGSRQEVSSPQKLQRLYEQQCLLGQATTPETAALLCRLGVAWHQYGAADSAIRCLKQAGALVQRRFPPDHPRQLYYRLTLGLCLFEQGQHREAAESLAESLAWLLEQYGTDHPLAPRLFSQISLLYLMAGNAEQAEAHIYPALNLHQMHFSGDAPLSAQLMFQRGLLLLQRRHYAKAIERLQQALTQLLALPGPPHLATVSCFENIGNAYAQQGNISQALAHFELALAMIQEHGGKAHPAALPLLNRMARASAQNLPAEALKWASQALRLNLPSLLPESAPPHQSPSSFQVHLHKLRPADLQHCLAPDALLNTLSAVYPLLSFSDQAICRDWMRVCWEQFLRSQPGARQSGPLPASPAAFRQRLNNTRLFRKLDQQEQARQRLSWAAATYEPRRFAGHILPIDLPQQLALEADTLWTHWQKHSQALRACRHQLRTAALDSLRVDTLLKQWRDVLAQKQAIHEQLTTRYPRTMALLAPDLIPDAQTLQQTVIRYDPQAALVYVVPQAGSYTVYLITRYQLAHHQIASGPRFQQIVNTWRSAWMQPPDQRQIPEPALDSLGLELYNQLLGPFTGALKDVTELILILPPDLQHIPWAALPTDLTTDLATASRPSPVRWVRRHSLRFYPSLLAYVASRNHPPASTRSQPNGVFLVPPHPENPSPGQETATTLLHEARETVHPWNDYPERSPAWVDAWKTARALHMAFAGPQDKPTVRRQVLLSPETMFQLAPLPPRLLVWESPDSLRSPPARDGMNYTALAAGTETVIEVGASSATRASQKLFDTFYRRWLGGRSASAALRNAQLLMSRDPERADPWYWGWAWCWGE